MAFEIGVAEPLLPHGESRAVVDLGRNAVLQAVSGRGPLPGGTSFVLTVNLVQIAFDAVARPATDATGPYWLTTFDSFGGSANLARLMPVVVPTFETDEAAEHAQRMAVEALLVYGHALNGLELPDGSFRVRWGKREWRLSDFGYEVVAENGATDV